MRIAYLIHQDPRGRFGGAEVYARQLAEAATSQGHEVLVLTPDVPLPARLALRASFDNPAAYRLAVERLRAFQPDHLHVHHFLLGSARLALWAKARRLPVTATLHDYWAFCHRITWRLPAGDDCPGPLGGWRCRGCGKPEYNRWPGLLLQPAHTAGFLYRNSLLRRSYAAMNAVFCPSLAVLTAHRENGFARATLVHRPYGLPFAPRLPKDAPAAPLRVGFIGRLAPEKGVELLLTAARPNHGFRLDLFGGGEAGYLDDLRARADSSVVTIHGSFAHESLDDIFAGVDVLAVPSVWRENLPLVVLEAAQRGVPVLAADNGGLAEMPELCGAVLVRPNTADAWAQALTELARRPERWRQMQSGMHYEGRIEDDLAAHLKAGESR